MWQEDGFGFIPKVCFSRDIVGIGERAYPRIGPATLIKNYNILCGMQTGDLKQLRTVASIKCVQEMNPRSPHPTNTTSVLEHLVIRAKGFLPKRGSLILLYRQTEAIREVLLQNQWEPMANPPEVWMPWENKAVFRNKAKAMGLPVVDFELVALQDLKPTLAKKMMSSWGHPLTFQIPDFPKGGGRATFFVYDPKECLRVREILGSGVYKGHKVRAVMVSPLIDGPSLSMEGCVTPWGVLTSPLQLQLVDLEEVCPPVGNGRFCGHQWGQDVAGISGLGEDARRITVAVGRAMANEGFRGIFGLDFIWDRQSNRLKLLECNPRYTGAFPTLTLLQRSAGRVPLELFHLLCWMGDTSCQPPKEALEGPGESIGPAAQIILFHRGQAGEELKGYLSPGRYRWERERQSAIKLGGIFPFPEPPYDPKEFVVLDGPPPQGHILGPPEELQRLVRIIFFKGVVTDKGTDPEVAEIVKWAYKSMGLLGEQEK